VFDLGRNYRSRKTTTRATSIIIFRHGIRVHLAWYYDGALKHRMCKRESKLLATEKKTEPKMPITCKASAQNSNEAVLLDKQVAAKQI
jgi:hypothetical protein